MIFTEEFFDPIYDLLEPCKIVEQNAEWHPEGNVYVHSFQTLHHALRESDDTDLILAAFCHDAGKAVRRLGHESESAKLVKDILSHKSYWLISQHMRIWYLLLGDMRKQSKVKELLNHHWLPELIALARWDKMARKPGFFPYKSAQELADIFNEKAKSHFGGPRCL